MVDRGRAWQVSIDTGGTFTDAVALDPRGRVHRAKVLSTSALRGTVERKLGARRIEIRESWGVPGALIEGFRFRLLGREHPDRTVERYDPVARVLGLAAPVPARILPGSAFEVLSPDEAPILATRLLTKTSPGTALPPLGMRLATTLGTNALLERRGVRTALFITHGFGDLLRIGTQQRRDLFALDIRRPAPLYEAVVEVPERLASSGRVIEPLDSDRVARDALGLVELGIRTGAVALLHSYRNPRHEREVKEILKQCGFGHVSLSSELSSSIKILPRAETCVIDAYLGPVLEEYLEAVASRLQGGRLHVMTSAGGLVPRGAFRPKDSLASGPAGGVVGAVVAARRSGFRSLITFDMGGTSTDVARFDRDFEYVFEREVGDAHLVAPALAIESVAAGGGSICSFDGERLRVGPASAGASPGPACYGAGGPLTLTDVNLLLGRLDPGRFGIPISPVPAAERLHTLSRTIEEGGSPPPRAESLLEGFLEIASERMADAIRRVSVRRGYDPEAHVLVVYGGAGGQHACAVAERLRIRTILVPSDAALLSAVGLGHAVLERFAEREVLEPLDAVRALVPRWLEALATKAARAVAAEGIPRSEVRIRRRIARLRFVGQDSVLDLECGHGLHLGDAFEARYRALFGHLPEERRIELASLRVVASSRSSTRARAPRPARRHEPPLCATTRVSFRGRWRRTPVFERELLRPGARLVGPALLLEPHSATVVEPGWTGTVDGAGALVLRRSAGAAGNIGRSRPEVVRLELFTNRFRSMVEEMGERLRRTAVSTNIKERLDFSCALMDADGELVVNAPHIPVHLGALGLCTRQVREALPLGPEDVAVTNHPAYGGSHLPDITVLSPVYSGDAGGGRKHRSPRSRALLLGYVASRAHHAEIGGSRPGSMPPSATTLAEEGIVIPPMHVIRGGRPNWARIRRLLLAPPFPSRAVEDNLADLRAAVAANHAGTLALEALAQEHGAATVRRYMKALKRLADRRLRGALRRMRSGRYEALERLDDGSALRVRVTIEGDRASLDFEGSRGIHPGNLNATPAIVRSVVIYVLRLLVLDPLPLNEGLLHAISVRIPRGILNPGFPEDPSRCPAVVGGNVETSQRLVDTLLKALRLAACSQGTMNNVLFGTARLGYYETVCGGCGAGPDFEGASAVHSHMTNTRITDPEILEHRYPVRLERFAIRRGSGGAGRYRGGDGALREITFLAPMTLSILSQHRRIRPYGLRGGEAGLPGAQHVVRATGEVLELGPIDGCEVGPGDRLVLATPGGGGYGRP